MAHTKCGTHKIDVLVSILHLTQTGGCGDGVRQTRTEGWEVGRRGTQTGRWEDERGESGRTREALQLTLERRDTRQSK